MGSAKADLKARHGYEDDYVGWLNEQAALLRAGELDALDRENIAEELESLGRSDRRALSSHLEVVMLHMLKMHMQPALRTRSWKLSLNASRKAVEDILEDSPSLRRQLPALMTRHYKRAMDRAVDETMLAEAAFPKTPPFSLDQVLGEEVFPPEEYD